MGRHPQCGRRASGHVRERDYPYLTVDYPHIPLAIWTDEEIAEVASDLAPKILELLTSEGFEAARGAE